MTAVHNILAYRDPKDGSINAQQHAHALRGRYTDPIGAAWRNMLAGWAAYADHYRRTYEARIGEDGVLGPQWLDAGKALLALLDGETGGWDAGSLHHNIKETMRTHGFDLE